MNKRLIHKSKNLKKGDVVIAIAGNDKGRTGTVQTVKTDRVIVQGFNVRKKNVKKSQENPKGRVVEIERAIHISNVKLYEEPKS